MSTIADELSVVNEACGRIGADPFQTFEDVVPGASTAGDIYRTHVAFLLDAYPFPFGRETRLLAKDAGVTPVQWAFAYLLPPERLGDPVRVIADAADPDAASLRHELVGRHVLCDHDPVWGLFKVLTPPARWSPAFREAAVLSLASVLAQAIAGDSRLAERLRAEAVGGGSEMLRGGALGVAIRNAAQATPARRLPAGNPLTRAWTGSAG